MGKVGKVVNVGKVGIVGNVGNIGKAGQQEKFQVASNSSKQVHMATNGSK